MTGESEKSQNEGLIEARRQYDLKTLSREQLHKDPLMQFENWLRDAREANLIDATAMALTSVDSANRPHTRMVLLKQFDVNGFTWFTDQTSAKGRQLADNNCACILFYWRELERQIRIEGHVQQLDPAEADSYFQSRPAGSRFSAAASNQSSTVSNRLELEQKVEALNAQYPDGDVPRPERWGGYTLKPDYFEFWQGRNDRLHDRFSYSSGSEPNAANTLVWDLARLSP